MGKIVEETSALPTMIKISCALKNLECVHNALFSSQLSNGPNKQEFYITLGWKDMPWTNAIAFQAHP